MNLQTARIVSKNILDAINNINLSEKLSQESFDRALVLTNLYTGLNLYLKEATQKLEYIDTELKGIDIQLNVIASARNNGCFTEKMRQVEAELLKRKEDLEITISKEETNTILKMPDEFLSEITSWY